MPDRDDLLIHMGRDNTVWMLGYPTTLQSPAALYAWAPEDAAEEATEWLLTLHTVTRSEDGNRARIDQHPIAQTWMARYPCSNLGDLIDTYVAATTGDHAMARLAVRAGLTAEETRAAHQSGALDAEALRSLRALRNA